MAFETTRCVKLSKIVEELSLEKLFYLDEHDDVKIETSDINRPGLQLVGYFEYFGTDRIQIFGKVEMLSFIFC
jgi:HPr kinase/phosphorylase